MAEASKGRFPRTYRTRHPFCLVQYKKQGGTQVPSCFKGFTMIRPTTPEETTLLVDLTEATGLFKPLEVEALTEVFADYFGGNRDYGHRSITADQDGMILGFAYYAPAAMTDRTWYLYWIAVRKDIQARGIGTELLRYVEKDI